MTKRKITASLLVALFCLMVSAGCAPQVSAATGDEGAEQDAAMAFEFAWSAESDCSTCHAGHSETAQADVHAAEGMDCSVCHVDTAGLEAAHEGVLMGDKEPKRLKLTDVANEVCLSCHDRSTIIEETADLTVLTDVEGTTVNPHDMPEVEGHQGVVCADCHNVHDEKVTQEAASDYCLSCHHHEVYECYTCHE